MLAELVLGHSQHRDVEIDHRYLRAFNGRGDVKVIGLSEENGLTTHHLKIDSKREVFYRFQLQGHEDGRIYWFYIEDMWFKLERNFIGCQPQESRQQLVKIYGPHLHLDPAIPTRTKPLDIGIHPFNPEESQIHLRQAVMVTVSDRGDLIERGELFS